MRNVLLLGGAGFVGLNLAIDLMRHGYAVTIIDPHVAAIPADAELDGVKRYAAHVGEVAAILAIVEDDHIDCVVNLVSGLIPSSNFEQFLGEITNITIPSLKLLEEIAARAIKYVYFSSGGTVYGDSCAALIEESTLRAPINYYGQSKMEFEDHILFAHRTHGLDYLIIRPSNPYGRYQDPNRKQGFVTVAIGNLINNQPIEVWGDGSVVRDYIHIDDLTSACRELIAKQSVNGTFNIGSGRGHSINNVLAILSSVTHRRAETRYLPSRKVDVQRIVLDISKLQSVIDFTPRELALGIESHFRYLQGLHAK
jgi:UDP-glucose 4-epimerase